MFEAVCLYMVTLIYSRRLVLHGSVSNIVYSETRAAFHLRRFKHTVLPRINLSFLSVTNKKHNKEY